MIFQNSVTKTGLGLISSAKSSVLAKLAKKNGILYSQNFMKSVNQYQTTKYAIMYRIE